MSFSLCVYVDEESVNTYVLSLNLRPHGPAIGETIDSIKGKDKTGSNRMRNKGEADSFPLGLLLTWLAINFADSVGSLVWLVTMNTVQGC